MFFDGELLLDVFAVQLLLFSSLGFIFPAPAAWLLVLFVGNPSKGSLAGHFFVVSLQAVWPEPCFLLGAVEESTAMLTIGR